MSPDQSRVTIRGSEFILLPERAVYWPEAEALFCSDLHWGRESYLQRKGFAVPERSFEREAVILEKALSNSRARELWILGDFIHHPEGLHPELFERMKRWLKHLSDELGVLTRLIPGNHDRKFYEWTKDLPLEVHPQGITRGQFIFLHEPEDARTADEFYFCWSGHLHPAFYPGILGGDKLPCFWIRKNEAYLPAFSRMAGGMEIGRLKPDEQVFVIADQQVIEI